MSSSSTTTEQQQTITFMLEHLEELILATRLDERKQLEQMILATLLDEQKQLDQKEEEEEEKKEPKHDPDTDNDYDDFVGILREILPQLMEWLVDLNGSWDTEMERMINFDNENKWSTLYRVMIPFLNTMLTKIGIGCFVSSYSFHFLKLQITNHKKFKQNLANIGDYLNWSDANILALIEKNSGN